MPRPVLTTETSLGAGGVVRTGSHAAYRAVRQLAGEPHVMRTELASSGQRVEPAEPVACIVHITDLHVTDVESPGRFEWVNRFARDPRFHDLLTMQRPQESLNTHAIAAMLRTINSVAAAPLTGHPPQIAVMTGDAIDNTQHNELTTLGAATGSGR